jgi:hypothetical protein
MLNARDSVNFKQLAILMGTVLATGWFLIGCIFALSPYLFSGPGLETLIPIFLSIVVNIGIGLIFYLVSFNLAFGLSGQRLVKGLVSFGVVAGIFLFGQSSLRGDAPLLFSGFILIFALSLFALLSRFWLKVSWKLLIWMLLSLLWVLLAVPAILYFTLLVAANFI